MLQAWDCKICCNEHTQQPSVDATAFQRFLSTLPARVQDLATLRKPDLKAILFSSVRRADPELKFCLNFWERNAAKVSVQQQEQVEDATVPMLWPRGPDDRAAMRPVMVRRLAQFEKTLDRRRAEFLAIGATSVESVFSRHALKSDAELRFCYDFLKRVFPRPEEAEQQRIRKKMNDVLVRLRRACEK